MVKNTSKESLAEKTRIYIDAHPSVKDCVSRGLINYSSLARMIMKDLELDNEEAVMIACRRYASKLGVTTDHEMNILRILKNSCLEMRYSFTLFMLEASGPYCAILAICRYTIGITTGYLTGSVVKEILRSASGVEFLSRLAPRLTP